MNDGTTPVDRLKNVKDVLLSSGLPLEYSVEQILRRLRFEDITPDFAYARETPEGNKEFSVDFAARKLILPRESRSSLRKGPNGPAGFLSVSTDFQVLVECKYTKPDVRWFFSPYIGQTDAYANVPSCRVTHRPYLVLNGVRSHTIFDQDIAYPQIVPHEFQQGVPMPCPWRPVFRGVELRLTKSGSDEAFGATIRRAVSQLQFGVLPFMWPAALGLLDQALKGTRSPASDVSGSASATIYALVLVTTSSLHVFKNDCDVESVKNAKTFDEIADPVDAVECITTVPRDLLAHQRELVAMSAGARKLTSAELGEIEKLARWGKVAEAFERASPSVLIVNYSAMEQYLGEQLKLLTAFAGRSGRSFATEQFVDSWE